MNRWGAAAFSLAAALLGCQSEQRLAEEVAQEILAGTHYDKAIHRIGDYIVVAYGVNNRWYGEPKEVECVAKFASLRDFRKAKPLAVYATGGDVSRCGEGVAERLVKNSLVTRELTPSARYVVWSALRGSFEPADRNMLPYRELAH